jgi:hypothetical protein
MRKTPIEMLVAMTALVLSGCGTIGNVVSKDPDVYGGLKKDIDSRMLSLRHPLMNDLAQPP